MDKSTIIAIFGAAIAVISLSISISAFWFTWLRRGRLSMTKPTIFVFGYDNILKPTAKIFLRSLLYSTSAKGQIVEGMHLRVHHQDQDHVFSFWGYKEKDDLCVGSGLFVGSDGISLEHHFVHSNKTQSFSFMSGLYVVVVYARIGKNSKLIKLNETQLTLSDEEVSALSGRLGVLFELEPDSGKYASSSFG